MKEGVFIEGIGFHANKFASQSKVTVQCVDFQRTINAEVMCDISLDGALDGNGQIHNSHKVIMFDAPVAVKPHAVLGFRTIEKIGSVGNARIALYLKSNKEQFKVSI